MVKKGTTASKAAQAATQQQQRAQAAPCTHEFCMHLQSQLTTEGERLRKVCMDALVGESETIDGATSFKLNLQLVGELIQCQLVANRVCEHVEAAGNVGSITFHEVTLRKNHQLSIVAQVVDEHPATACSIPRTTITVNVSGSGHCKAYHSFAKNRAWGQALCTAMARRIFSIVPGFDMSTFPILTPKEYRGTFASLLGDACKDAPFWKSEEFLNHIPNGVRNESNHSVKISLPDGGALFVFGSGMASIMGARRPCDTILLEYLPMIYTAAFCVSGRVKSVEEAMWAIDNITHTAPQKARGGKGKRKTGAAAAKAEEGVVFFGRSAVKNGIASKSAVVFKKKKAVGGGSAKKATSSTSSSSAASNRRRKVAVAVAGSKKRRYSSKKRRASDYEEDEDSEEEEEEEFSDSDETEVDDDEVSYMEDDDDEEEAAGSKHQHHATVEGCRKSSRLSGKKRTNYEELFADEENEHEDGKDEDEADSSSNTEEEVTPKQKRQRGGEEEKKEPVLKPALIASGYGGQPAYFEQHTGGPVIVPNFVSPCIDAGSLFSELYNNGNHHHHHQYHQAAAIVHDAPIYVESSQQPHPAAGAGVVCDDIISSDHSYDDDSNNCVFSPRFEDEYYDGESVWLFQPQQAVY